MLQGKDFGKTLRASTKLAADVKAPRIMGSERLGHRSLIRFLPGGYLHGDV
jgi:hypothetical protein